MDSFKFAKIFLPRASFYLWVILILDILIAYLNWMLAIPCFALWGFLIFYNYRTSYKRHKEITSYIENLTFNIDTATKDTLLNFPMPLVLLGIDGTIIWYNTGFREIIKENAAVEGAISDFINDINPASILNEKPGISKELVINEKHFEVLGNFVRVDTGKSREDYILMLYFIDKTELILYKEKYYNEKVIVGLIIIDNYDELMQSTEESYIPQLIAEIEKRIQSWINFAQGIVKKFERDKFLLLFSQEHFKEIVDKKFEILDSVKEINVGNKIPVTLSIGLGLNGESLNECQNYASMSIDIALGRGGDQAVVKDREHLKFYGGKTREHEKKTRVKARVIAHALRELIDQAPFVMIMGHENSDIDSLGSALGLYRVAVSRGKDAWIVLNNSNPGIDNLMQKLQKNPEYKKLFLPRNEAKDKIEKNTLLIVVDTHRPSFTECPDLLEATTNIVVIDHHRRGADFIQDAVLTYQETYASSTCELVTEILQYMEDRLKLMPLEAEALYAGIVIDTKNFTFKTGVRTFEAASFLRKNGVDPIAVKQLFQNDLETYINRSNAVRSAEIINETIAVSVCPPNIKNSQLIAAQAADELLSLTGVMAAFVLSQDSNVVAISGRSLGEINVQVILEKLGGGGHMTVAGAQLPDVSIEQAKEKLKNAVAEYFKEMSSSEK